MATGGPIDPMVACLSHPQAQATSFCTSCGRPMCPACAQYALGTVLCRPCYEARLAPASATKSAAGDVGAALPGVRVLRPLNFVDLFDEAFSLYRNHFVLLVGVLAIVNFPATFLLSLASGSLQTMGQPPGRFPSAAPTTVTLPDATAFFFLFGALILTVFAATFGQGALTKAVSDVYLNRPTGIKTCYSFLFARFFSYLGTVFVAGLVSMVGTLLCCVGLFWAVFATQCFVVEGTGAFQSVERSMFLSRGNWWRCFVVLFVTVFVIQVAAGIAVAPIAVAAQMAGNTPLLQVLTALAQSVMTALLQPLQMIVFCLLYFDLRVRKEGFDLQLLASSLGHN